MKEREKYRQDLKELRKNIKEKFSLQQQEGSELSSYIPDEDIPGWDPHPSKRNSKGQVTTGIVVPHYFRETLKREMPPLFSWAPNPGQFNVDILAQGNTDTKSKPSNYNPGPIDQAKCSDTQQASQKG